MASRSQHRSSASYSADAASPPDEHSGSKRKTEDGNGPHQRAKRNRYISIACNECKRRKIKCNGQTPCQRCGNLQLSCVYSPNCCSIKDSDEFKEMNIHLASLQEQVDTLYNNLNSLRGEFHSNVSIPDTPSYLHPNQRSVSLSQVPLTTGSPTQRRKSFATKHPAFRGPTSSAFNFGVAKSSLQTMGITGPEDGLDEGNTTQNGTPAASPAPSFHPTKDPIWQLSKEEAVRLCRVYEEENGLMYPVLNIERVIRHAVLLYTFIDAANRTGLMQRGMPGADALDDEETMILKLILSVAMVTESNGVTELGRKLYDNVHPFLQQRLMGPADLQSIRLLTIAAMYHFHRDDESLAWRMLGLTTRWCLELGLHRRDTYITTFTDDEERSWAVKLFWAIYCLDRRWSFGTGLPFGIQDADIDPLTPKPDDSVPYLTAMIAYSHIGSKVWRSVANVDGARNNISKEEIGYLDYQVVQWHSSIPDSLRYRHPSTGQEPEPTTRAIHRLRVILYLRANQMRILIYRPVLHSATSIMENPGHAQTVTAVAKDTIRVLTHVNQTSDIYRTQQVCFNHFLISALAVLFLAVSHAPAQFSDQCRDEFYMALELVRGFSEHSYVSKRLWKTIMGLKEVGPKLGLFLRNGLHDPSDAHSSAAVAMAGLAGHAVDELALFHSASGKLGQAPAYTGSNPDGMANDLVNLFEAAGGYAAGVMTNGGPPGSGNGNNGGYPLTPSGAGELGGTVGAGGGDVGQVGFGNEDELTRILRDLF